MRERMNGVERDRNKDTQKHRSATPSLIALSLSLSLSLSHTHTHSNSSLSSPFTLRRLSPRLRWSLVLSLPFLLWWWMMLVGNVLAPTLGVVAQIWVLGVGGIEWWDTSKEHYSMTSYFLSVWMKNLWNW